MKTLFNKIHYSNSLSFIENLFKSVLLPFSFLYLTAAHIRNFLYKTNILKKTTLPVKVISVGNLTTGGTGKTPVIIELARYLKERTNKRVAVLSHGYGGKLYKKGVNVVSDGKNILLSPELAGDEACIIAENLKYVPVICGKDRIKTGKYAVKEFGVEILLLDDGFQHIRLNRNLNLLLIDCSLLFGNGLVLPAGPLREPLGEIKRADKVLFVDKNPLSSSLDKACESFVSEIKSKYKKPVFLCRFMPGEIINIKNLTPINDPVSKVFAFSGVAQPSSFFDFVTDKGYKVVGNKIFDDHYAYDEDDIVDLLAAANDKGAEILITTEKDAVKIRNLINGKDFDIDFYFLKISLDIDTEEILNDIL